MAGNGQQVFWAEHARLLEDVPTHFRERQSICRGVELVVVQEVAPIGTRDHVRVSRNRSQPVGRYGIRPEVSDRLGREAQAIVRGGVEETGVARCPLALALVEERHGSVPVR